MVRSAEPVCALACPLGLRGLTRRLALSPLPFPPRRQVSTLKAWSFRHSIAQDCVHRETKKPACGGAGKSRDRHGYQNLADGVLRLCRVAKTGCGLHPTLRPDLAAAKIIL